LPLGMTAGGMLSALWPVAAGAAVYGLWRWTSEDREWKLPEGDIAAPLHDAGARGGRLLAGFLDRWMDWDPPLPHAGPLAKPARRSEAALGRLAVAGLCLLLVILGLWWTMS
jgi:hypothetical protein